MEFSKNQDGSDMTIVEDVSSTTESHIQTNSTGGMQSRIETPRGIDDKHRKTPIHSYRDVAQKINSSQTRQPLRGAAAVHHGEMKLAVEDGNCSITALDLPGTYIVSKNSEAMLVCYSEYQTRTLQSDYNRNHDTGNISFVPECGHLNVIQDSEVYKRFMADNKLDLLQAVIIPSSDYNDPFSSFSDPNELAAQLGSRMGSSFVREFDTFSFGFDMHTVAKLPMRIITDWNRVQDNLYQHRMHNVLPAVTGGYTVEICTEPEEYQRNNAEWQHLFTVGTMPDVIRDRHDPTRFNILPTTTAFASSFRTELLQLYWMYTFYLLEINYKHWNHAFKAFHEERWKNIGSLWIDEESQLPMLADNIDKYRAMAHNFLVDPVLAVDARYGEYLHPAMSSIMVNNREHITEMYKTLGINDDAVAELDPIYDTIEYYTGHVVHEDKLVDSRTIDYFKVAPQIINDRYLVDHFLNYYDNPEDRLQTIASSGWGSKTTGRNGVRPLTSIYSTTKHVLSSNAVLELSKSCAPIMNITRNLRVDDQPVFDYKGLREQGRILNNHDNAILLSRGPSYQNSGRITYGATYDRNRKPSYRR